MSPKRTQGMNMSEQHAAPDRKRPAVEPSSLSQVAVLRVSFRTCQFYQQLKSEVPGDDMIPIPYLSSGIGCDLWRL